MASVTFPVGLGGDGSTVTDDRDPTTGLRGGGYRTRFVPALSQTVAVLNGGIQLVEDEGTAQIALVAAEGAEQIALATAQAVRAETASDIAVGAANYRGDYSPAITYLTGQSVSYLGNNFVAKKTNMGITPIDGNDWLEIKAKGVYRSFLNQSTDITLTDDDAGGYIVVQGTDNLQLFLPDATTCNGRREFTIKNTGDFLVLVKDFNGRSLFTIKPETSAITWASDISTSDGIWAIYENTQDTLGAATEEINAQINRIINQNQIASISDTKAVKIYTKAVGGTTLGNPGSYNLYAVVVTNTAGSLTYGTPVLVATEVSVSTTSIASMCVLTPTSGVILYSSGTLGVAFTVSGDSITVGAPATILAATTAFSTISSLSSTTAVVTGQAATVLRGVVVTVSGLTITVGVLNTALATVTSVNSSHGVSALSSALFTVLYAGATNSEARTVTVTGTGAAATLTPNAVATVATGVSGSVQGNYSLSAYTSTALFAHFRTGGTGTAVVLTVSGTAISVGTAVTVSGSQPTWQTTAMLSATNGVNFYSAATTGFPTARAFTISGTAITQGTAVTLQASVPTLYNSITAMQTPAIAAPTATTALVAYNNESVDYLQAINVAGSVVTANASFTLTFFEYGNPIPNSPFRMAALSTTRVIYLGSENAPDGRPSVLYAYLMDPSGFSNTRITKIEVGTMSAVPYVAICPINTTQAIAVYISNTGAVVSNVITMSGGSLSVGAQATINAGTTNTYVSIGQSSGTSAVVHYFETSASAAANVLTVSGSVITVGPKATVTTNNTAYNQIAVLSSTRAIAWYKNVTTDNSSDATLLTISGTTITPGATLTETLTTASFQSIVPVSSTRAFATAFTTSGGNLTYFYTIDLSGETLSRADSTLVNAGAVSADMAGIAVFDSSRVLVKIQTTGFPMYPVSISAAGFLTLGVRRNIFSSQVGLGYSTITALQTPAVAAPDASEASMFYRALATSGSYETRKYFTQSGRVQ